MNTLASIGIQQALQHADETKDLIIGTGVLNQIVDLCKRYFPGQSVIIIADKTTYRVAGKQVEYHLNQAQIEQLSPVIVQDESLYAEYQYVEFLIDKLTDNQAIPIVVGSGTINDLTKLASHLTGRRYISVATAASMDGYTAFGASITYKGAKQTFNCPAPLACLVDMQIIKEAPAEMTASGYADLFAKIPAGADWILADSLGVEKIDELAWEIMQNGLHDILQNPMGIYQQENEAYIGLIQGLMMGGFAMQAHKTSRPASGAEHQFSHLWNMEHHTNQGKDISHGFQVAIGTLASIAMYELFLQTPIKEMNMAECAADWKDYPEIEKEAEAMFRDTDFPEIGKVETKAKYINREDLLKQLLHLQYNWDKIKTKLEAQLIPYDEVIQSFALVGAPIKPEDIGVSREYLKQSFIRAQYIRRRYTILDMAVQLNLLDKWLEQLFGKDGIWGI